MHLEAIAGHKADSPYFSAAIKETQYWGEDVRSPTGREINGIYLDANEEDIKKQFAKFKLDWPNYDCHNDRQEFERYMAVINPRMGDIANESYVNA
ncbi:hypothetical protein EJB05_21026, partial [Eragrostis curvula]